MRILANKRIYIGMLSQLSTERMKIGLGILESKENMRSVKEGPRTDKGLQGAVSWHLCVRYKNKAEAKETPGLQGP